MNELREPENEVSKAVNWYHIFRALLIVISCSLPVSTMNTEYIRVYAAKGGLGKAERRLLPLHAIAARVMRSTTTMTAMKVALALSGLSNAWMYSITLASEIDNKERPDSTTILGL
jgi:hypothetical protein